MEYRWIEPESTVEKKKYAALASFPRVIQSLLIHRGITRSSQVQSFFDTSGTSILGPETLTDTNNAVKRIEDAIDHKERIFIHGDFDADGISATAILWDYLYRIRGADVLPYIPSRIDEGYGLSEKSLSAIHSAGGQLVITVDCGVRDGELIKKYMHSSNKASSRTRSKSSLTESKSKSSKSLDFIVTDHHQLGDPLPPEVPLVHPLHPSGSYKNAHLSGAAVAWKLVWAMEQKRLGTSVLPENVPGVDLAGFATICDLMPLTGENRSIVSLALQTMRKNPRVGIRALVAEASIRLTSLSAYDIGFILGPRINAAGRIGDPLEALRLWTTHREDNAHRIASTLGQVNRKRQEYTDAMLEEVKMIVSVKEKSDVLLFASGENWNEGIIGLVAGKLQELYHRPVVIVSKGADGARGSARSIHGFNIVEALSSVERLLEKYGGHALAGGFSVKNEHVEELERELQEYASKHIDHEMLTKTLSADVVADAGELDWEVMNFLQKMEPFGYGNKKPLFWVKNAIVVEKRCLGNGSHIKLWVKGLSGDGLECVYWNGTHLCTSIKEGDEVELMGNLEVNEWNGSATLQFRITDLRSKIH